MGDFVFLVTVVYLSHMNTKEKIILGIAGVLVIAGVALASTGVISFKSKDSSSVFQKIAEANAAVTSSHIDLTVKGSFSGESASDTTNFTAQMSGVAGKTETSQSADLHFAVTGSGAGSEEVSMEGDFRLLDRMFYLRATKLPPIPFIDPSMIMNKWFSIDPISMYKEFGNAEQAAELEHALSASSKMPPEFTAKSYSLAVQEGVVSKIAPKNNEVISGIATQKYELTVNPEKIPAYMVKYTELYNSYAKDAGVDPLPVRAYTEEDMSVFKTMKFSPVAVWVGKADSLPYKLSMTITLDGLDSEATDGGDMSGTMSFDAIMSDYNKAVTVEKPAPVTPIMELFQSLMGGM